MAAADPKPDPRSASAVRRVMFGWCLTNSHEQCRYRFRSWHRQRFQCKCECHRKGAK